MRRFCVCCSRAAIDLSKAFGNLFKISRPSAADICLCDTRNSTFWRVWDKMWASRAEESMSWQRQTERNGV